MFRGVLRGGTGVRSGRHGLLRGKRERLPGSEFDEETFGDGSGTGPDEEEKGLTTPALDGVGRDEADAFGDHQRGLSGAESETGTIEAEIESLDGIGFGDCQGVESVADISQSRFETEGDGFEIGTAGDFGADVLNGSRSEADTETRGIETAATDFSEDVFGRREEERIGIQEDVATMDKRSARADE